MSSLPSSGPFLTPEQLRSLYNCIGRFLDWQAFYEQRPFRELLRGGEFHAARSVLEFGCGTGALAANILQIAPADCRYVGIDLSPVMLRIARSRLSKWAGRASLNISTGSPHLDVPDGAFDRFVSTYVFDLLAPEYATEVLAEAYRVLQSDGKLCLVSLTRGESRVSRVVTKVWEAIWRRNPGWVGGCRPLELRALLKPEHWSIEHHAIVISFGVPSEVLIACRRPPTNSAA